MTATRPQETGCDPRERVDPRGPRFGGGVTTVVLALVLVDYGTPLATALLLWQALVFGLGAFVGLQAQPYGLFFRRVVQPRLAPAVDLEGAAPPRFAQLVGFVFVAVALLAGVVGATSVALAAVALALTAAFLNAGFGLCLGCECYLLGRRVLARG